VESGFFPFRFSTPSFFSAWVSPKNEQVTEAEEQKSRNYRFVW
jgi:hypothetical protein